ncbi:MAG: hypothetical protein GC134_01910 [Proteobacteria bacterium]|nr:hypothetical protein [Pseudomonadota bacterium]
MGSLFSPKVPSAPPPPPAATYRDEIGGTEQVPITNPDGSTTYITRQLPLTEEQQQEKAAFEGIMQSALDEIKRLSTDDFADDPAVKSVLDDYTAEQSKVLSDVFTNRSDTEEAVLAKRGLADSSAAQDIRRQRQKDELDARSSLQRQANLLKDDIRNERINLQQNLYNIAATRQDLNSAKTLQSAASGFNAVSNVNAYNRASSSDAFRNSITSHNTGLNTLGVLASTAGAVTGGPVGGLIGAGIAQTFAGRFY